MCVCKERSGSHGLFLPNLCVRACVGRWVRYSIAISEYARDPDGMDAKTLVTWVRTNCTHNALGEETGSIRQDGTMVPELYRVVGEYVTSRLCSTPCRLIAS